MNQSGFMEAAVEIGGKEATYRKAVFGVAPTPPAPLLEPEPQIAASPRYAKNSSSSSIPCPKRLLFVQLCTLQCPERHQ